MLSQFYMRQALCAYFVVFKFKITRMLTIGLDIGTQGTKCIVYDINSKAILGRGAVSYGIISERHGQAEQDPATWVQVLIVLATDSFFLLAIGL